MSISALDPASSAHPQPGPAVDKSRAQGPASAARGRAPGIGSPFFPSHQPRGPPPTSHGLTQETTAVEAGSLALSSEISSFTTLQADTAVRQPHWGLFPSLGSGLRPPACQGVGHMGHLATRGIQPHQMLWSVAGCHTQHLCASGDHHHPPRTPPRGPWGPDTNTKPPPCSV